MAEVGGLLGLFKSRPQELVKTGYAALPDEALIDLIFTEADSLPMEFAREAISRGERLVPALAEAALNRDNWDRSDSGWCSAFHACFLLGAIGGEQAAKSLLEAFDISEDVEKDWVSDEWASIFGRLGPAVLAPLKERATQHDADHFWRQHALCGMAAVALRHPEHKPEALAFIAAIAGDADEETDARIWAGDILLDFRLKEHEALLLSLAELPENDVYHPDTVREALSKKEPDLYWYQHDWLEFYSPEELAERRNRWEGERLSEEEAWQEAMADLREEERELPPLSSKQAEKLLGDLLPLARRIEEMVDFENQSLSKEELLKHYSLAMEAYEAIRQDRSRFRLFDAYLEDMLGWLIPLPLDLAAKGLVDEGARLSLAWSDVREPKNFLADRAILLAEAGREAQAREQLDRNLKLFSEDLWVQIKAGQAYEALGDFTAAEARYRLARAMPDDDRDEATQRLIDLLKKTGKTVEAQTLEAEETQRRGEARRRTEEAQAAWTPVVRQGPKIGRNDTCPCGSGKKHKKCCLNGETPAAQPTMKAIP